MQMKQYHDKQTSYPHVHFYAGITSDGQVVVVKGTIFEQTTSMLKWDADFLKGVSPFHKMLHYATPWQDSWVSGESFPVHTLLV